MSKEEEYIDDEYINSDNDPCSVEKIVEPDYTIVDDKEKVIDHEEIVYSIDARDAAALKRHDEIQEKKLLDALRDGTLR